MLENEASGRRSRGFRVVVFWTCACTNGAATIAAPSETKAAIRMANSPDVCGRATRAAGTRFIVAQGGNSGFEHARERLIWTSWRNRPTFPNPAPSAASPRPSAFGRSAQGAARMSTSIAGFRAPTRSRRRNRPTTPMGRKQARCASKRATGRTVRNGKSDRLARPVVRRAQARRDQAGRLCAGRWPCAPDRAVQGRQRHPRRGALDRGRRRRARGGAPGAAPAAGAWLGGQRSALLMQSSGVGNCINMLSLINTCRFPFLTFITMRGEWAEFNPWQVPMSSGFEPVLTAMGVKVYRVTDADEVADTAQAAADLAFGGDLAVAVLLSQKLIGRKVWVK